MVCGCRVLTLRRYSTAEPLESMFGDVRVVLMGGSSDRIGLLAKELVTQLNVQLPVGTTVTNIARSDR